MQILDMTFHKRELCLPCAVAGVVFCRKTVQIFGVTSEGIIQRQFGEMEAADQDIRLKPADNVQYASVGTTAEQDLPAVLFHE